MMLWVRATCMNDEDRIEKDAAYWIEQINRPAIDTSQSACFDAWMAADPRHAESFARLQIIWDSSAFQRALGEPDILEEEAAGPDALSPAAGFSAARPPGKWWAAAAVVAAFVLVTGPLLWMSGTVQHLETGKGVGASLVLDDGSRVELSPNAEIRAEYWPWSRMVILVRGEAYFDVKRQAWRPFRVESGANEVKVLGTAFNVDRQSEKGVSVEVYRGRVALRQRGGTLIPIDAGRSGHLEGARLSLSDMDQSRHEPEWKSGWFDASEVPLSVLIDKLNRYADKPVIIRRADLTNRNITGRFRVRDVGATLQALEAAYNVRPNETSDAILLE